MYQIISIHVTFTQTLLYMFLCKLDGIFITNVHMFFTGIFSCCLRHDSTLLDSRDFLYDVILEKRRGVTRESVTEWLGAEPVFLRLVRNNGGKGCKENYAYRGKY